jgi:hypothetical protein
MVQAGLRSQIIELAQSLPYEVLIAEIFWFGQQTAYDSSLVVWTRRNANDYTTITLASTARQQK